MTKVKNGKMRDQFVAFYRKTGAQDPEYMFDQCMLACDIRKIVRDSHISEERAAKVMEITKSDYMRLNTGDFEYFQKGYLEKCLKRLRAAVRARHHETAMA